jgi:hypothetical protein
MMPSPESGRNRLTYGKSQEFEKCLRFRKQGGVNLGYSSVDKVRRMA